MPLWKQSISPCKRQLFINLPGFPEIKRVETYVGAFVRTEDTPPMSTDLLCSRVGVAATAKLLQLCPTLCNPIDGSPPGSPVCGILQARTLEWVAISFSNA